MRKLLLFILLVALQTGSCNLLLKNKIKGTWYFEDDVTHNYREIFFYNEEVYTTRGGLGPVKNYYEINRNSIILGIKEERRSVKYKMFKDSLYIFFEKDPMVLKKSIIQVPESVFDLKNKSDLDSFFIEQLKRGEKNYLYKND